jgi:uncharacterized protein YegP (UPF0339 family)
MLVSGNRQECSRLTRVQACKTLEPPYHNTSEAVQRLLSSSGAWAAFSFNAALVALIACATIEVAELLPEWIPGNCLTNSSWPFLAHTPNCTTCATDARSPRYRENYRADYPLTRIQSASKRSVGPQSPSLAGIVPARSPKSWASDKLCTRACASLWSDAGSSRIHLLPLWEYSIRKTLNASQRCKGFDMVYEYWQSKSNAQWYWHLKAANGEKLCASEGYRNETDCLHCIGLVKASSSAPVRKVA